MVVTIPYKWQKRFKEFRQAYEPDGLKVEEFDDYGATRRTLRQFLSGNHDLFKLVRDIMVANPDG